MPLSNPIDFSKFILLHAAHGASGNNAISNQDTFSIPAGTIGEDEMLFIIGLCQDTGSDFEIVVDGTTFLGATNQATHSVNLIIADDQTTATKMLVRKDAIGNSTAYTQVYASVGSHDINGAYDIVLRAGKNTGTNARWRWGIYKLKVT